MDETIRLLKDTLDRLNPYGYSYVEPTREMKVIEEACRDYLREHYRDLPPVRWFEPAELADFKTRRPVMGSFNAETGELRVRADKGRYDTIYTLLHEAIHSEQVKRVGVETMKVGSKKGELWWHRLEGEADHFARQHTSNVQFRVGCRLQ